MRILYHSKQLLWSSKVILLNNINKLRELIKIPWRRPKCKYLSTTFRDVRETNHSHALLPPESLISTEMPLRSKQKEEHRIQLTHKLCCHKSLIICKLFGLSLYTFGVSLYNFKLEFAFVVYCSECPTSNMPRVFTMYIFTNSSQNIPVNSFCFLHRGPR